LSHTFTPWSSLVGGILIGVSAAALLLGEGRIAGITGIVDGALKPRAGDLAWRLWFLAGLVGGGFVASFVWPSAFPSGLPAAPALLVAAGLLVGFGTRLGNGCTSGHGVCGLGRASTRSLVAVLTFMAAAAVTVFVMRHLIHGGAR
jgi:uncharacterized membrane protein YedE/YeeE